MAWKASPQSSCLTPLPSTLLCCHRGELEGVDMMHPWQLCWLFFITCDAPSAYGQIIGSFTPAANLNRSVWTCLTCFFPLRGRCYPHLFSFPGAFPDLLMLLKIANWPWKLLKPLLKILQELGTSGLPQYPNSCRNLEIYRVCCCTHFQRAKGRCFLLRSLAKITGLALLVSCCPVILHVSPKACFLQLEARAFLSQSSAALFFTFLTLLPHPCFFRFVRAQPAAKLLGILFCCFPFQIPPRATSGLICEMLSSSLIHPISSVFYSQLSPADWLFPTTSTRSLAIDITSLRSEHHPLPLGQVLPEQAVCSSIRTSGTTIFYQASVMAFKL